MNVLHKKEKLRGNRCKNFFSKVSRGNKETGKKDFYRAFCCSSQAGTSCREGKTAAVMAS